MPQVEEAEQLRLFENGPNVSQIRQEAEEMAQCIRAKSTMECYTSDWRDFQGWCAEVGRPALPCTSETLKLYIAARLRDGKRITTMKRRLAAVSFFHRQGGHKPPETKETVWPVIHGEQRRRKEVPRQRTPLLPEDARKICRRLLRKGTTHAIRDRALLTLGLASGLRASNIAMLDITDLRFVKDKGVAITIRSSKTDQIGRGKLIGIFYGRHKETCPVRSLQDWLKLRNRAEGANPQKGPVFASTREMETIHTIVPINNDTVNRVVKERVAEIGMNPNSFGGHSLRAGFVTAAYGLGADELSIMERTGHKSVAMVRLYLRNLDPFAGKNPIANAL